MWKECFAFFVLLPALINAQCNPGSIYSNNRCFTLFQAQVDFKTAESICMVSNGHLASVHNTIDNNFIAQEAQKYISGNSSIWLGAKSYSSNLNDPNSWNWTDATQFDYQNYQSGQPESLETQACIQMSALNGKWRTSSCINYAPFICEYEIAVPTTCTPPNLYSCPSGYYYYQPSQTCFKVVIFGPDRWYTWSQGQQWCRGEGAELASVHSADENNFLTDRCKAGFPVNKHYSISIGLYTPNNDMSNFHWSDGSSLNYANWANGEPNNPKREHWTAIMPDPIGKNYDKYGGEWNNVENTNNRGYICKASLRRS